MTNYFDNQKKWEWIIKDDKVLVTTDHGSHTHTMDISDVSLEEMEENVGQVMGDAHRSVPHDFKTEETKIEMEEEVEEGLDI